MKSRSQISRPPSLVRCKASPRAFRRLLTERACDTRHVNRETVVVEITHLKRPHMQKHHEHWGADGCKAVRDMVEMLTASVVQGR